MAAAWQRSIDLLQSPCSPRRSPSGDVR